MYIKHMNMYIKYMKVYLKYIQIQKYVWLQLLFDGSVINQSNRFWNRRMPLLILSRSENLSKNHI